MSGIYIHIPFCKTKCHYCDFYKSTDLTAVNNFVLAIEKELLSRHDYLADKKISTIYFGGGTPSVLDKQQIAYLLKLFHSNFEILPGAEITFEANPDDLTAPYLDQLISTGINRLSIGIQSFSDDDLKFMGRRHTANQAKQAVKDAQNAGFKNISVDLIYGMPGMSFQQWKTNLQNVFDMHIQHLSAYHLTYHENTNLWSKLHKGIFNEVEEEESLRQFEVLIEETGEQGFIHYEISNFALEGYFSKHNSSYWNQTEYLGLGPSAHSFNKTTRYWNPANIVTYLERLRKEKPTGDFEILSPTDRYNDYIITGLRTMWGIDKQVVLSEFGKEILFHLEKKIEQLLPSGVIDVKGDRVIISKKGIFITDKIIEEFFM